MQGDPHSRPEPIGPSGLLDGLDWRTIFFAAVLDIVLSAVGGTILVAWLSPDVLTPAGEFSEQAWNEFLQSPEFLRWSLVMGLAVTGFAAYWGAQRAGRHPVRHGGWIAIASALMGTALLLIPGANEGPGNPLWYDVVGYTLMVPAGLLGGFVASKR